MNEIINEILTLIWVTFLPFLELRASIPYGILKGNLNWFLVFIVCVISNIIVGAILYPIIEKIIKVSARIDIIKRIYSNYIERMQKRINRYVEKYGEWALAVFIGIPLPGSGVYSAALAAYLLGLSYKKFMIANIVGVLIAGIIVTIIVLSGVGAFQWLVKIS